MTGEVKKEYEKTTWQMGMLIVIETFLYVSLWCGVVTFYVGVVGGVRYFTLAPALSGGITGINAHVLSAILTVGLFAAPVFFFAACYVGYERIARRIHMAFLRRGWHPAKPCRFHE